VAVEETLDLNLGPQDQKTVAAMVNSEVQKVRYGRQAMDNLITGYWERYEARPPSRILPFSQATNLRVPLTQWIVDGIWVRMMRTVFGQLPYLRVQDEDVQSPPEALPIQIALQHLADTDLQLRFRGGHLFLNALVEGTAIGKIVRDETTRTVRDRRPPLQRIVMGDTLQQKTVVDKNGLGYDVIDMKDFWVAHPAIVDVDKQPWVAHRVWIMWDELVRRVRDGVYTITQAQLEQVKPLAKSRLLTGIIKPLDEVKAKLDQAEQMGFPTVKEYEIFEAEWRWDRNGDGKDVQDCLFTTLVGMDDFPLRAQKYPFWNGKRNYVVYRPRPRANRFYGRSTAGEIQPIQDEADARINQDLDAATIEVLAGLTPILQRNLRREWENHQWKLLEPIYVDAPEQFRSLAQSLGNLRVLDPQLDRLFQLAERISGMSDPQLGKPVTGSKTAFEIATVQSEGNIKFSEMIEQLQLANKELGFQIIEHAYQLTLESPAFKSRLTKVAGIDPFQNMTMEEIRARWEVIPVGNTMVANREIVSRMWMGIFQLLKDDIFVQVNPEHGWFIRNRLLQSTLTDPREVEQIIGSEQEVKAFAKAQIAQRAQQGDLSAQVMQQHAQGTLPPPGPGPRGRGRTRALGTEALPGVIEPPGAFIPPPQ
jgi:hypothetical protein